MGFKTKKPKQIINKLWFCPQGRWKKIKVEVCVCVCMYLEDVGWKNKDQSSNNQMVTAKDH